MGSLDELAGKMGAESWGRQLRDRKDYRGLAAIYNSTDYRAAFRKAEKQEIAGRILQEAGREAVDAVLQELATGGAGSRSLAGLLVGIGDPKAVPLLKRKLDRGDFRGYEVERRVRQFVERYPERYDIVETVHCALCGTARPVTEMRGMGERYFCLDTCWPRRGRVLKQGIGTDCPHYLEGQCTAGEDDALCSLQSGSYESACYVYAVQSGSASLRS